MWAEAEHGNNGRLCLPSTDNEWSVALGNYSPRFGISFGHYFLIKIMKCASSNKRLTDIRYKHLKAQCGTSNNTVKNTVRADPWTCVSVGQLRFSSYHLYQTLHLHVFHFLIKCIYFHVNSVTCLNMIHAVSIRCSLFHVKAMQESQTATNPSVIVLKHLLRLWVSVME